MITVTTQENIDKDILNSIENIGKLSLPIFYSYDDLKNILELKDNVYTIYIAKKIDKVVGFAITAVTDEGGIHIMSIASDPKYRRQNIGTKLLNEIKSKNIKEFISLYVQSINKIARKFYRKNKFIEIEKVDNYYSNLEDNNAILMAYVNPFYL